MKMKILGLLLYLLSTHLANAQWEKCKNEMSYYVILSLTRDNNNIFAGGHGGSSRGIFLSTDQGENWEKKATTQSTIYSIAVKDSDVYAGGPFDLIYSDNYGNTWTKAKSNLPDTAINVLALQGINLYAGTPIGLYLSTNKGKSWSDISGGISKPSIYSIIFSNDSIFIGTNNGIFLTINNGNNWIELSNNKTKTNFKIFKKGSYLFAGGTGLYMTCDYGKNWIEIDSGLSEKYIQVITGNENVLFVGTVNRGVFYSTNNGTSWIQTDLWYQFIGAIAILGDFVFASDIGGGLYKAKISDILTRTDVTEDYSREDIIIYPNPVSDYFEILGINPYSNTLNNIFEDIRIYNLFGEIVLELSNPSTMVEGKVKIDVSRLPIGIYYLWTRGK